MSHHIFNNTGQQSLNFVAPHGLHLKFYIDVSIHKRHNYLDSIIFESIDKHYFYVYLL